MPTPTNTLDGDTTPLVITDRPMVFCYDPLPEGCAPAVVRARDVRMGDLLIGDFAEDLGKPRRLSHWSEIVTADPAPMTVPCLAACCWNRAESDVTRYVRLAPAVDDETPCEIFAVNAPVLVVRAVDRLSSEGVQP